MPTKIQLRRGTASQWTTANTVLLSGEMGYETDTGKFKFGDGTTAWNSLAYNNYTAAQADSTFANVSGDTFTGAVSITDATQTTTTTTGALIISGGIGVAKNVYIGGNLNIAGNFTVSGTTTTVGTQDLVVTDPMIYMGEGNTSNILDLGFVASFNNGTYQHTGLVRDATDGIWKLFSNVVPEPTTTVDFTSAVYDTLKIGALQVTDAATTRTNLGLGTMATETAANYALLTASQTFTGTQTFVNATTAGVPIVVNGVSGTSDALLRLQVNGSTLAQITASGALTTGNRLAVGNTAVTAGVRAMITNGVAGDVALGVRGAASQTANLTEWQNDTGSALSYVTNSGHFRIRSTSTGSEVLSVWASAADRVAVQVRGFSSQTANLTEWQDSTGSLLARIDSTGHYRGQQIMAGNTGSGLLGQITSYSQSATTVGLVIRGAASQSANLLELQNSSGTVLGEVSASGGVIFRPVNFAGNVSGGIRLTDNGNNWTSGGMFIRSDSGGNPRLAFQSINSSAEPLSLVGGQVGINTTTPSTFGSGTTVAQLAVNNATAAGVGLVVRGASSQSNNLQEWQDSTGAVLSRIGNNGYIYSGVVNASSNLYAGYQIIGGRAVVQLDGTAAMGMTNWNTALNTLQLRNVASQSADSILIQTSSATNVGGFNSLGQIFTGSTSTQRGSSTFTVSAASASSTTVATFTTSQVSTSNPVAVGQRITTTGFTAETYYNGTFVVTAIGGSSGAWTVTVVGSGFTVGSATVLGTFTVPAQASSTASSAGTVGLLVRGATNQIANLQEWQNSNGSNVAYIASNGYFNTSASAGITGSLLVYGGSTIVPSGTGGVAFIAKGLASQTGDLQQWQDSAGTVLAKVSSTGNFTMGANLTFTNPGIGNNTIITFTKSSDQAWLKVTERSNDQTTYEFGMADNPDGSDHFQWRFDDYQGQGTGWMPLQLTGFNSRFVARNNNMFGNLVLPYNTGFYTYNASWTGTDKEVGRYTPNNSTSVQHPKDSGTGTGTLTVDATNFTGTGATAYWVVIEAGGTTFRWGTGWWNSGSPTATGVTITGSAQTLSNGLTVTLSLTGHLENDRWNFRAYPAPQVGIGGTIAGAMTAIQPSAGTKGLVIKAAGSQSVNLFEWQNSSGNALGWVSNNGTFNVSTSGTLISAVNGRGLFVTSDAAGVALTAKAATSQSANIFEIQNTDSAVKSAFTASGYLVIGGGTSPGGQLGIIAETAGNRGMVIRGAVSQSANLTEWQNSAGSIVARVSAAGSIVGNAASNMFISDFSQGVILTIKGVSNQNADAVQYTNFSNTVIGGRNANAQIYTGTTAPLTTAVGGATTAASGTGTVATITTTSAHNLAVGDRVTVAGVTPTGYNGTYILTAVTSNTISYSSTTTGSQTVAGTVSVDSQVSVLPESIGTTGLLIRGAGSGNQLMNLTTSSGVSVLSASDSSTFGQVSATNATMYVGLQSYFYGAADYGASVNIQAKSTSTQGIIVRGRASQTANLQEWQESNAGVPTAVDANGRFRVRTFGTSFSDVALASAAAYASEKPLVLRGFSSQTANLTEWQDSTGVVRAYVAPNGNINSGQVTSYGASSFIANTSTDMVLRVKGASSQTADLQQWQDSAGTVLSKINSSGWATFARLENQGLTSIGTSVTGTSSLLIDTNVTTRIGAIIKGVSSQTADLQQWQDSAGSVLMSVNANGRLYATWGITTSSSIILGNGGVSTTAENVYTYLVTPNAGTPTVPVMVVRSRSGQATDLQQWQNSGGSSLAKVDQYGGFYGAGLGPANQTGGYISTTNSTAVQIITNAAATQALIVKGATSQTADLQQWQDSSGNILSRVESNGTIRTSQQIALTGNIVALSTQNSGGVLTLARSTAQASSPGANFARLYLRDGTTAGTLSLKVKAGASGVETTLVDNIDQSGTDTSKLAVKYIDGGNAF